MGRELYETQPIVRETLDQCAAAIRDILPRPLLEAMFAEDGAINHTSYAQPALFALEMGLARCGAAGASRRMWWSATASANMRRPASPAPFRWSKARVSSPSAGVCSAHCRRAAPWRRSSPRPAPSRRLSAYPHVSVAAYNGAHIVISGPQPDVLAVAEQFRGEGKRAEALETSHAFHSELLEPALDAFEAFAEKISFENLTRTLVCNRTGKALGAQTRLDAQYWRRHSRQPVQFAQSVQTLASLGCRVVLEIGPQPVLAAMALRAWPDATPAPQPVASLRRDFVRRATDRGGLGPALCRRRAHRFQSRRGAVEAREDRSSALSVSAQALLVQADARAGAGQEERRLRKFCKCSRTASSRSSAAGCASPTTKARRSACCRRSTIIISASASRRTPPKISTSSPGASGPAATSRLRRAQSPGLSPLAAKRRPVLSLTS